MIKLTLDEIFGFKIGVRVHSYLRVSDNGNMRSAQEFFSVGGEHPVAIVFAVPVSGSNPPFALFGVTAFRPLP